MNSTGYFRRPTQIPLPSGPSANPNRAAIAGAMNMPFGGSQNGFGFPAQQAVMNAGMPPGGGQMPVPPSLNFVPGVGTSSPSMTGWQPPAMGMPPPNMNSNPMFQPGAPTLMRPGAPPMGPVTR